MRRAVAGFALAAGVGVAAADLYRWVDPESGSVKFSSLPPPWYGDPALERRAPKVEVIRSRAAEAPTPAPLPEIGPPGAGAPAAPALAALEARRRQIAAELRAFEAQAPQPRSAAELAKRLEAYARLVAELDRIDPHGAQARGAQTEALLRDLVRLGAR
jgi:hypothetical protein